MSGDQGHDLQVAPVEHPALGADEGRGVAHAVDGEAVVARCGGGGGPGEQGAGESVPGHQAVQRLRVDGLDQGDSDAVHRGVDRGEFEVRGLARGPRVQGRDHDRRRPLRVLGRRTRPGRRARPGCGAGRIHHQQVEGRRQLGVEFAQPGTEGAGVALPAEQQVGEEPAERALTVLAEDASGRLVAVEDRLGRLVEHRQPHPGERGDVTGGEAVGEPVADPFEERERGDAVGAQDRREGAGVAGADRADTAEHPEVLGLQHPVHGPEFEHPAERPHDDRADLLQLAGVEVGVGRDLPGDGGHERVDHRRLVLEDPGHGAPPVGGGARRGGHRALYSAHSLLCHHLTRLVPGSPPGA